MKILKIVLFLGVAILVLACTSSKQKSKDYIERLIKELYADTVTVIDPNKATELVKEYENYAESYPDDMNSPEYLFKAAHIAMNSVSGRQAIEIFRKIMITYPDYEKTPECLFFIAYIYDNTIQDLDEAKIIYQEFIDKYPENEFADDAQASIKNLGKSPEELIREFEEKLKATDSTAVEV